MNKNTARIERLRRLVRHVPTWIPTIVVLAAVLWLTLAPHPVGDMDMPLFEGADKLAHGIMFMVLTITALFDLMRSCGWSPLNLVMISGTVFMAGALGVGIEFLQKLMDAGRSFEWLDVGADFVGAVFGAVIWIFYQWFHLFVVKEKDKDKDKSENE